MDLNAAKAESWDWNDESFTFNADSPLAISQSLWDEWTQNEADAKTLFSSTPSSEISDPRPSAMPICNKAEETRMRQAKPDPDVVLEDSLKYKRRRMLHFAGEQGDPGCSTSTSVQFREGKSVTVNCLEQGVLNPKEDKQTPDSSDASLWFSSNAEEMFCTDIEGERNWMLECFNEDHQLVTHEQLNSFLPLNPFPASSEQEIAMVDTHKESMQPQQPTSVAAPTEGRLKLAAPVAYPFAVLKPSGVEGDVTLKDINQRILMPPTRPIQHPVGNHLNSTSASSGSGLSGKAVVACTKIHTEGKGTITIMRTKG